MCNYLNIFSLALIGKMSNLVLSLAYAPVPREENTGGGGFLWTIAGVLMGVLVGLLIYKLLGKSAGKRGR